MLIEEQTAGQGWEIGLGVANAGCSFEREEDEAEEEEEEGSTVVVWKGTNGRNIRRDRWSKEMGAWCQTTMCAESLDRMEVGEG